MINFVVKPSSYTGASDTNGGGYVDGYDATYANFCNATGGPTTVYQFSEVAETGGVYSFTFTSGTGSNYIAGQLCHIEHPGYGFWYGRVVATYPADVLRVVYMPVNAGTGYLSEASIATLITNNIDAGGITVGGALASVAKGCELSADRVLVEDGDYTHAKATLQADIIVLAVSTDGTTSNGVNLTTNGEAAFDLAGHNVIMFGVDIEGPTVHMIERSVETTESSFFYNCGFIGNASKPKLMQYIYGYNIETMYSVCYFDKLSAISSHAASKLVFKSILNSVFVEVETLKNTDYGTFASFISNLCVDCGSATKAFVYLRYSGAALVENNIFVNKTKQYTCIDNHVSTENMASIHRNIFMGWDVAIDTNNSSSLTADRLIGNAFYNNTTNISDSDDSFYDVILSADPFVDSANGDYRLDPDGPDFDKLYDATTGRVLIGATGPELTTGTGGTGVCNLIGNGGMIE